jgi:group I intron endonuclease
MERDILEYSGIYKITCNSLGKIYIGSAQKLSQRFWSHRNNLSKNKHPNYKLQRAWEFYGEESFVFEPILICRKEDLLMYEQKFLDLYECVENGLNICPTAGSQLGVKKPHSEAHKLALKEAWAKRKADKGWFENFKKGQSETQKKQTFMKTDEYREKMSEISREMWVKLKADPKRYSEYSSRQSASQNVRFDILHKKRLTDAT